jgi:hypothetical protein
MLSLVDGQVEAINKFSKPCFNRQQRNKKPIGMNMTFLTLWAYQHLSRLANEYCLWLRGSFTH